MNILLCIDERFVMPAVVLLTSIGMNGGGNSKTVYLLSEKELSEESQKKLKDVCEKYDISLNFVLFDLDKIWKGEKVCMNAYHWSFAIYLRLFIASVLPQNVSKVLYLDCDTIVRKSLEPLWNIDITNYAIAGVREANQFAKDLAETIKYDVRKYEYVNSGVLLINLDYFRKNNIEAKFIEYINENKHQIKMHDQEVINNILFDKKLLLPSSYNAQFAYYLRPIFRVTPIEEKNIMELLRDPVIVHYTSRIKPWLKCCRHPLAREFRRIQKHTIYKDDKPKMAPNIIKRDILEYILFKLHLNFKLRYV